MSHKSAKRKRYPDFNGGISLDKFIATWNRMAKAHGKDVYTLQAGPTYTARAKALGYANAQEFLDDFIRSNDAGKTP